MALGGVIVIKRHEVYKEQSAVGTVLLDRRGLYWTISCRCQREMGRGMRLTVAGDPGPVDLGILYPMGDQFGLETTVPVKRLGEGELRFFLEKEENEGQYIELDPSKPFSGLDRLEDCRFRIRNEKPCIFLSDKK